MQISELALLLSVSQALFLAVASFLFQRRTYIGKLLLVFSLGTLAYLYIIITDMPSNSLARYLLGHVPYLIPGVIWLMAFALFRHETKVPVYVWTLIAAYFLLTAMGQSVINPEPVPGNLFYILFHLLPQIIKIGIYVHTLSLAVLEYRQDLIESRRSLRVAFVATLGAFWLWVCIDVTVGVLIRMGLESLYATSEAVKTIRNIFIFPYIFAVNLMLFRVNVFHTEFSMEAFANDMFVSSDPQAIDSKDYALKDRLLEFMEKEKPYREAGLSIGELAKLMGVQERRLRSVINRVLKYSNFSHFLNSYRVREAQEALVKTDDSIYNIGMDAGYTSPSCFHKAFKDKHGTTPKEYRVLSRSQKSVQNQAGHGRLAT